MVFKRHHKTAMLAALVGVLAAIPLLVYTQPKIVLEILAKANPRVLYYLDVETRSIALTIDDGPHSTVTPAILEVLRKHDAHATFFVLGENVPGNEKLLTRILAEGHEIGNHMMKDRPSVLLRPKHFESELVEAHQVLTRYSPVKWFRPGSGWFTKRMVDQVERHGYNVCLGSIYPHDTKVRVVSMISNHVIRNAFPGGIIIFHDGAADRIRTVEVLRTVLPALVEKGYEIVTVSELMKRAEKATRR